MLDKIIVLAQCLNRFKPGTKIVSLLSILLYLMSMVESYAIFNVAAQPRGLIKEGRIFPLFTFSLQHMGLGHLVFALISFNYFSAQVEARIGFFKYILSYFMLNLLICLLSITALFLIGNIWKNYYKVCMLYPISGLWPITMVYMIEVFAQFPEAYTDFLFFPFQIRAKWYPICFFIVWLLAIEYVLEIGIGIIVGYICKFYLDTSRFTKRLFKLKIFKSLKNFIDNHYKRILKRSGTAIFQDEKDSREVIEKF